MTTAVRTVGVIGAGRMGQPIIGHMVHHGFAVVAYDLDPEKQAAVAALGAAWAGSAEALARRAAEVILVCVGYDRELREVISEPFLRQLRRGTIVGVVSTVHPRTVQRLSQVAATLGVALVDSTVCRGARGADEGKLLSFVGGDAGTFERLKPVLACFCSDIVHSGPVGTAQAAKAANNLIMWACLVANHEALALARRYGMDVDLLRETLMKTGAENGVLRHWGTSTMKWADDDLELVREMARDVGIVVPQAELDREICRALKPNKFQLDLYGA